MDTLDSVEGLGKFSGHQEELFGALSEENYERIKRQNKRKISVVLGNPPYNANQIRENDNNKNRKYTKIDSRIKTTYIARSEARKTKLYDPYVRFFRWASDRIRDAGIVAFITNRSFIDAQNFDGFRRVVSSDFDDIYIIDLGGDWKRKGVGGGGNVFGISTGVAISFWIRRPHRDERNARIFYIAAPQGSGEDKLGWLESLNEGSLSFKDIPFEQITPQRGYWVDHPELSFEKELPIASKLVKSSIGSGDGAIFKLFSLGISTNRDEWLYDRTKIQLNKKVHHFIREYNSIKSNAKVFPDTIKWSRNLKRRLQQGKREAFNGDLIVSASYRPYSRRWLYCSKLFVDELGASAEIFPPGFKNTAICFSHTGARSNYCVLAIDGLADLHFGAAIDAYQQVPRYRYAGNQRIDNITDWALGKFRSYYEVGNNSARIITKDEIFSYIYAVLHNPNYLQKYRLNLQRDFPRIPFYDDFWQWAQWGGNLLKLHLDYESVEPWPLERVDLTDTYSQDAGLKPRVVLRADKDAGAIRLNGETQLLGVPEAAWKYQLGNRSAIEWVLDQHSEKPPRDPTVEFHGYSFARDKEMVIDLLRRITRVSVETQKIVEEMRQAH